MTDGVTRSERLSGRRGVSSRSDSNRRPADYKSAALPAELRERNMRARNRGAGKISPHPTGHVKAAMPGPPLPPG